MIGRTERGKLLAKMRLECLKIVRGYTRDEELAKEFGVDVQTIGKFRKDPYATRGVPIMLEEALKDALKDAGLVNDMRHLI